MVYLNEDIKLGKKGVNYVTTVVDECMCSFHKIEQENDIGIDGQIELFDEGHLPIGILISVQVKTGRSYYDLDKAECYIPIGAHREYWMKIEMPVIGIVCVMDEKYESVKTAFWVDIKEQLLLNPTASTIKFNMSIHNELSKEKFRKYFYCLVCKKAPIVEFDEALLLLDGSAMDKVLAMDMLLTFFSQEVKTWEIAFSSLRLTSTQLVSGLYITKIILVISGSFRLMLYVDCKYRVKSWNALSSPPHTTSMQHRQPQIPYFRAFQDIKTLTKR